MIDNNSTILVTGGTGLVGRQILTLLSSQGWTHIIAVKRSSSIVPVGLNPDIQWIEGDILDVRFVYELMSKVDVVIHAAADVGFSIRRKNQILKASQSGTAHLVDAALESGVKRFVFVSSIAAIGRKKETEYIDELQIFSHSQYDTSYGLAKFLAEQEVWRAHAEGLSVNVINPSMIIGPGDFTRSSLKIFDRIYHQKLPYYPTGSNGWVDVRDVALAAIKCTQEEFDGHRFIISCGNLKYEEVFRQIADHLHVPFKAKPLQFWLGQIGWRIEAIKSWWTGSDPMITSETVKSTSVHSTYNNQKSISILKLSYISIDQSISDACNAYLSR
jgi:dihydroflavonol-4-reductase